MQHGVARDLSVTATIAAGAFEPCLWWGGTAVLCPGGDTGAFFLEQYGSRRFLDFCRNLRDGQPIDRALSFATSGSVRSLQILRRPGSSSSCSFLDTPYETGMPDPRVEIFEKTVGYHGFFRLECYRLRRYWGAGLQDFGRRRRCWARRVLSASSVSGDTR